MKRHALKWVLGLLLIGVLLAGARSIVRINEAAMGEAAQSAGFYGH